MINYSTFICMLRVCINYRLGSELRDRFGLASPLEIYGFAELSVLYRDISRPTVALTAVSRAKESSDPDRYYQFSVLYFKTVFWVNPQPSDRKRGVSSRFRPDTYAGREELVPDALPSHRGPVR